MKIVHYVVITPIRNEEEHLQRTIESISAQSITPQEWIIVDDGSTDESAKIALAATRQHKWIRVIQRQDRGFRKPGGGVIEAFYDGYRQIKADDWQALVKLDGDLSFGPDYFENCLRRFELDAKLGIGGGTVSKMVNNALVPEAPGDPSFHVRGATKIYKRDCWEAIGGLILAPGWDTVDEYKANMLGWVTYTFPELKLRHHRAAGGAEGTWKNCVKNGLANYVAGYHPLFMIMKCVQRSLTRPYGMVGLGLLVGFFSGYIKHVARVNDRELIRYLRQQQLRRLFFQESLWDRKPAATI